MKILLPTETWMDSEKKQLFSQRLIKAFTCDSPFKIFVMPYEIK